MSKFLSRRGGGAGVDVLLVAAVLFGAASIPAQVSDGSELQRFFEPIEVPLVNVDVHVTGAHGRAVPGLVLADFEVLEDGRPVEITHFAAASWPAATDTAQETGTEPGNSGDQELCFVVFLNESDISPLQYRTIINHLRDFLTGNLPAALRLMLITSEGSAVVRVPLTDDPSRFVSVLDEMASFSHSRLGNERDRILRDLRNTAGAMGSAATDQSFAAGPSIDPVTGNPGGRNGQTPQERMYVQLANEARQYLPTISAFAASQLLRTEHLLGELEMLVGTLSVVPGRKAILLVSDGLEARPGEGLFLAWEQSFPVIARQMNVSATYDGRKNDVGPRIQSLAGSANRHRVSFYTLSGSSRFTGGSSAEAIVSTGGRDLAQTMADQGELGAISRATGGRSLLTSPGLTDSLDDVVHEMGSYYSLGYSPGHPTDGQHHALSVRVRGEGLSVRHREGYIHSPSSDRIAERTLAAAVLGITDNPLGVSVETQEVGPLQEDGGHLVSVLVKVPIARLMLRPEGDRHTGRITALVLVRGEDGMSDPQSWRYPINVANDQMREALGTQAGLVLHLALGKGPQRIAVGVRDDVAGTEASAIHEIDLSTSPSTGGRDD